MPFWKRKKSYEKIQCSICEWTPDGGKYWACSCGHSWNTFDTKGKCPKCNTQWENTRCIGCGKNTPHKDWYKSRADLSKIETVGNQKLRAKKKRIESKLIKYGINNHRIANIEYLDHSNVDFQSAHEAGCRMIILNTISYAVHHLEYRSSIVKWFKTEDIWNKVSPIEKSFLTDTEPKEEVLANLSWRIESAITLGWCLKKVNHLHKLDNDIYEKEILAFRNSLPNIGESLGLYLHTLEYRDFGEIYEENLLNEIITTYFRDLLFSKNADKTKINRYTSFERHKVLNWLRKFMSIDKWDETNTST